jgi:hypothetical protein
LRRVVALCLRSRSRVAVLDAQGVEINGITVDLLDKLTPAQKTAIDNFMASLRAKATNEVLT